MHEPLDLNKIANLGKGKGEWTRSIFKLGADTASTSTGLGIGLGQTTFTLLALTGVSVATLFQMIALSSGAGLLGLFALGISAYLFKKQRQEITESHANINKNIENVSTKIIEIIQYYQEILDLQIALTNEHSNIEKFLKELAVVRDSEIAHSFELQRIYNAEQERLNRLGEYLGQLNNTKNEINKLLKNVSLIFVGETYYEKLFKLLNSQKQIKANDLNHQNIEGNDRFKGLSKAIDEICSNLRNTPTANEIEGFKSWITFFTPEKRASSKLSAAGISFAKLALGGVGGFLTGVGLTLTVATFVVGSAAALSVIGWPIAVAACGIGVLLGALTIGYSYYVESKQQKTKAQLELVEKLVSSLSKKLEAEKESFKNSIDNKKQQLQNEQDACPTKKLQAEIKLYEKEYEHLKKTHSERKIKVEPHCSHFTEDVILQRKIEITIKNLISIQAAFQRQDTKVNDIEKIKRSANSLLKKVKKLGVHHADFSSDLKSNLITEEPLVQPNSIAHQPKKQATEYNDKITDEKDKEKKYSSLKEIA
jgi:hypothetical protein